MRTYNATFYSRFLVEMSAILLISDDVIDKMVLCHSHRCHVKRPKKAVY